MSRAASGAVHSAPPWSLWRALAPPILLWCFLSVGGGVRAAEAQAAPERYDLAVLVLVPSGAPLQVALSYSATVDHERLRADIARIMASVGSQPEGLRIEDAGLGRGTAAVGTAAQFAAPGLLRRDGGTLPVGPIIRALPEWRRMRLGFVLPEGFRFVGPEDTTVDGFSVHLVSDVGAYEYDVERIKETMTPPSPPASGEGGAGPLLLAALAGAPTGFLVGWFLAEGRPRPSSGRSHDT